MSAGFRIERNVGRVDSSFDVGGRAAMEGDWTFFSELIFVRTHTCGFSYLKCVSYVEKLEDCLGFRAIKTIPKNGVFSQNTEIGDGTHVS
mmetsp:Transcript_22022/g.46088  ORF Transcript_22022/g.46088 Transcript_22022/m.46088 type:complete len:90 (-) Transcript_22022:167-436(-)